jgi:hypothetical protein
MIYDHDETDLQWTYATHYIRSVDDYLQPVQRQNVTRARAVIRDQLVRNGILDFFGRAQVTRYKHMSIVRLFAL